jgi:hypothetical protein
MNRYISQRYQFDRLFMSHLGSRLRPEYDALVRGSLPQSYWELLLDLELACISAEPNEKPSLLPPDARPTSPHEVHRISVSRPSQGFAHSLQRSWASYLS